MNKFENALDNPNINKPEQPPNFGDDPDAQRKEARKKAWHLNILLLHWVARVLVIGFVLFFLLLFFVILPVSQMTFDSYTSGFMLAFHEWSVAFVYTSTTAFIALATLIVSDLLKKFFDYLKPHINKKEKEMD